MGRIGSGLSQTGECLLGPAAIARDEDDPRALSREPLGGDLSDARSGPGYDDDLATHDDTHSESTDRGLLGADADFM
jgi:hypothetical protein